MSVQDSPEEMVTAEYWPRIDTLLKPEFKSLVDNFKINNAALQLPTLDTDYRAALWCGERANRFGELMLLSVCLPRINELRAEDRFWFRGSITEEDFEIVSKIEEPVERANELAGYVEIGPSTLPLALFSMRKLYFRMSRELPVQ